MTDPATSADPADPADPDGTLGYADAVAELEQLLTDLEHDDVDIDLLGAHVRRAAMLIRLCRDRIAGARFDVEQIVADLTSLDAASAADRDPDGDPDEDPDDPDATRS